MSFAFKIAVSLLSLLFCTTLGIVQLSTQHINSGLFCIVMGLSNLFPMWLNWRQHKATKAAQL